jgi:hypothetical protein
MGLYILQGYSKYQTGKCKVSFENWAYENGFYIRKYTGKIRHIVQGWKKNCVKKTRNEFYLVLICF